MARMTYVQDPKTGKLVPKDEYYANKARNESAAVHTFTEFVSPIDKQVISDNRQLSAHNKKHGVTNIRDYGDDHFKRHAAKREQAMDMKSSVNKRQRIETIKAAMRKHDL